MKNFLLSIAIFSLFSFKSFSHVDHYASFNYLEYELFRNNKSIGYHKFDFRRNGENLSIISEVNFKITKLGVDLYKYKAESEEKYKDGKYGWPESVVTDFGPIEFEGVSYDNMQMSFSHHHKKLNPYMVHFNWMKVNMKVKMMKRTGAWFL